MKINTITLNQFRQYYGSNSINLETNPEQNIILIGGQTGYGKTNFLVSLVWCLYGENIAKIDEKFKYAIQKEGNYAKFLRNSLNWEAEKEGFTKFSVEIEVGDVELPDTLDLNSNTLYTCKIIRSFDINSIEDDLNIEIIGIDKKLFFDDDDKISFINDYLIPIEAAKFVFFDAEKIANIAGLSTKEEGSVMNDALSKILGLDIYENLQSDLQDYCDNLKRESASAILREEIVTTDNQSKVNKSQITTIENKILEKEIEIEKFKHEKKELERYLSLTNKSNQSYSKEDLYIQREQLIDKRKVYETTFNELAEIMPFAIAAGKLEEIIYHLHSQDEFNKNREVLQKLAEGSDKFMEELFNKSPLPIEDISIKTKNFYAAKGEDIFKRLFGGDIENIELTFEHDLSRADKDLIVDTYNYIKNQSKEVFEQAIENFISVDNDILEVDKNIRKNQTYAQEDEFIAYADRRDEIEHKIEKLNEEKGHLTNQVDSINKANDRLNLHYQILLKKIGVSEHKKKKLDKANEFIKVLEEFIGEQKRSKCRQLEDLIYLEMQQIMHKFTDGNGNDFISKVKVEILPPNDGLKVILYNKDGDIKPKESLLSEGEKQIYISSLIKVILSLSTQELPIFIDTPLGRLDAKHIKNFLQFYYPNLGKQVILLPTDNEIPLVRYKQIEAKVAQKYFLVNKENKTTFKQGYFNEN
jgi:DNA sulfur modification protein DndD